MPDADWSAEGFAYLDEIGFTDLNGRTPKALWEQMKKSEGEVWVVRFALVGMVGRDSIFAD